jgi:hypothetical protein
MDRDNVMMNFARYPNSPRSKWHGMNAGKPGPSAKVEFAHLLRRGNAFEQLDRFWGRYRRDIYNAGLRPVLARNIKDSRLAATLYCDPRRSFVNQEV